MNKNEYLQELRERLKRLPQEDIDNAVSFYQEYLDDAGAENEEETIRALGTPEAVAMKIIGEYAVKDAKQEKKKGNSPLWIVILAIFASPIALPLAFALFMVILALGIVFFALSFAGVMVGIAGIISLFGSFWAFSVSAANGIYYLGLSLLAIGIGASMAIVIGKAGRAVFKGLQKWLGNILIRRGSK